MKQFLLSLFVLFAFSACNKNLSPENEVKTVGSGDFLRQIVKVAKTMPPQTKAGLVAETELRQTIQPLFEPAIMYLSENDYDYTEDFNPDDPNIILTALGVLAYDENLEFELPVELDDYLCYGTVDDIIDCVLKGVGIEALVDKNAKKLAGRALAKLVAKKLAVRLVPYVGTAITVGTTAACLGSKWL